MKHILLSILGLFVVLFNLNARSVFLKGYVIDNKNDTIWGLIKQDANISNTDKCIFKTRPEAEKQIYQPTDIKSYRIVDGKYYVSRLVMVNGKPQQIFLEYLVQGLVNIYLYANLEGIHYLVDKGDGNLIELKNTTSLSEKDGVTYSHDKKEYIGMLTYVFQDSPKTCEEATSKSLDCSSLIDLAVDYHKDMCAENKCIIYEKKADVIKLYFGLQLGVNYHSLTKGKADDTQLYFQNTQFNSFISPALGAFLEIKLPYVNNERLFARYDASLWQEKHTGSNEYKSDYTSYKNQLEDNKFNLLNSIQVKFDLNRNKLRYFVEGGVFMKMALYTNFKRTLTTQILSEDAYTSSHTGSSVFNKTEVGPILGLGIRTKMKNQRNVSLDLRYLRGNGVVSDQHFTSKRFSLNLSIQLL